MTLRKRFTAAAALALSGTLALPLAGAAAASGVGAAAYACNAEFENGRWYYGYYSGMTVIPSTSGVSSAGIEAQCSLRRASLDLGRTDMHPGTIDGVFGPNSQSAMRAFQRWVNSTFGSGTVSVDGLPGPESWPYLRMWH
jgi:peptidoglycan hydrolase-like protein with peptidoglycan-binding domain